MFEIGELNSAMRDTLIQPIFLSWGDEEDFHWMVKLVVFLRRTGDFT